MSINANVLTFKSLLVLPNKDTDSLSGIALNAITLTVADEESDSDDGEECDNENGGHANGNGEQNGGERQSILQRYSACEITH